MVVTHELSICVDCLLFVANGDLPEDEKAAAAVVAGVESFSPGYVTPACAEDCEGEFSWRPCGCCSSSLGGVRHPAVVLGEEG